MTTRYFLAIMMLALAAAGVVWIAIEQRPHASMATVTVTATSEPPPPPPASPPLLSPSASAPPIESASPLPLPSASSPAVAIGDAGEQAFPPLAANAAWSVVRWDMSAAEAAAALKEAGVAVVEPSDPKPESKRVRAKGGPSEATIDFGA